MATKSKATSHSELSLNEELWKLGSKMCSGLTNKGSDLVAFLEQGVPSWCEVESYQLIHFDKERKKFSLPNKVSVKHFQVDSDWYGWHSTMRKSPKDHYFDCLLIARMWHLANTQDELWTDDCGRRWHIKSLPKFGYGTAPTCIRIKFKSGISGWIEINCSGTLPLFLRSGVSGNARSIELGDSSPQVETEIEFEFG